MKSLTPNRSKDDHMVSISAKNGDEILYRLAVVRDCYLDKNRTHVLCHVRREVETSTLVRLNNGHNKNIFAKMVCISITVTEIFDAGHFWTAAEAEAAAGQRR